MEGSSDKGTTKRGRSSQKGQETGEGPVIRDKEQGREQG